MIDWTNEYFEETEFNELMSDFLEKCKDIANDKLKNFITNLETEEMYYRAERKKYFELKEQLDQKEKDLVKMEEELTNKRSKILKEEFDKFGGDLKIGQKVYYITSYYKPEICGCCNGTGEVKLLNFKNEEFQAKCPKCCGYKSFNKKIYSIGESKVKKINMEIVIEEDSLDIYQFQISDGAYYYSITLENGHRVARDKIYLTRAELEEKVKELNSND